MRLSTDLCNDGLYNIIAIENLIHLLLQFGRTATMKVVSKQAEDQLHEKLTTDDKLKMIKSLKDAKADITKEDKVHDLEFR